MFLITLGKDYDEDERHCESNICDKRYFIVFVVCTISVNNIINVEIKEKLKIESSYFSLKFGSI